MDLHTITMEEARTAAGDRRFGPSVQGQELIVCEITVGQALGELPGGTSPDDVPIWTASTENPVLEPHVGLTRKIGKLADALRRIVRISRSNPGRIGRFRFFPPDLWACFARRWTGTRRRPIRQVPERDW